MVWRVTVFAMVVAVAAEVVTARDVLQPGRALDEEGSTTLNNKDSLKISEGEIAIAYQDSPEEKAKVKTCDKAGGKCLLKKTAHKKCNGKLNNKYKCNKNNICCISELPCKPKNKCKIRGGTCQKTPCGGTIISKGCKGKGCICCKDKPPVEEKCYPENGLCKGEGEYCEELQTPCKEGWDGTADECAKEDGTKCQCCKPATTDPCMTLGGVRFGSQCLTFNTELRTWDGAAAACANNNGQLASLADNADQVLAYALTQYSGSLFWAGGSDRATEGNWVWMDGRPFDDQSPWAPNEPNNEGGNEDCLIAPWIYKGATYNDGNCESLFGYICDLDNSRMLQTNGHVRAIMNHVNNSIVQVKDTMDHVEGFVVHVKDIMNGKGQEQNGKTHLEDTMGHMKYTKFQVKDDKDQVKDVRQHMADIIDDVKDTKAQVKDKDTMG